MADEKYKGIGRYQGDEPDPGDALETSVNKATGGAPKSARAPYNYYSPEAKSARHEGLVDAVRKRNDAADRLRDVYQDRRKSQNVEPVPNYAKGGQVGKVGQFGMKRSKPDFAGGGDKTNFKMSTKKGKMPW